MKKRMFSFFVFSFFLKIKKRNRSCDKAPFFEQIFNFSFIKFVHKIFFNLLIFLFFLFEIFQTKKRKKIHLYFVFSSKFSNFIFLFFFPFFLFFLFKYFVLKEKKQKGKENKRKFDFFLNRKQ